MFNDIVYWSVIRSDELKPGYFFRKPYIHLQDYTMCHNPVGHNISLKKIFITCLLHQQIQGQRDSQRM